MNENVEKFFELYDSDPQLRERLRIAEECYPGSLEIREAVVEEVLLPVAQELGLPFTLDDLRKFETRRKMSRLTLSDDERAETECVYWLLEHGWEVDEDKFKNG